jgi:hypothetical protein
MIKYVDLEGYTNYGELVPFSHFYQFRQLNEDIPMIILVHAYECETKVFKGFLFNISKIYQIVPLTKDEKSKIESATGSLTEVGFPDFIKDTIFEEGYSGYLAA